MTQAKQLIAATLDAPAEFWRGHAHVRETNCQQSAAHVANKDAGRNEQAFPESDEKALKVAGSANTAESSYVPIRALSGRHRRRITEHLLVLPEHDRYLRFGYVATNEQVQKYVEGLDFKRDEIYGIFNRRLALIAMAHLALTSDPKCSSCAEFGVSVSSDARGKGLGTRLFERASLHARAQSVDMIFIHALSENVAMLKIARKAGAVIENYGGEVEAHVRLPAQDLGDSMETALKDAIEDGLGELDFRLKLRALQFWVLLASLQDIRKGLIAARDASSP